MNERTNFIIFMTDQQLGSTIFEDSQVLTPNIDMYRNKSTHFTNFNTVSPHCCPSRASFFTSKYPTQHGIWDNVDVDNSKSRDLYKGTPLFTDFLKQNGYNLLLSGKWHVSGSQRPSDFGFEEIFHGNERVYQKRESSPQSKDWIHYYHPDNKISFPTETPGIIRKVGYPDYQLYGTNENPYNDETVVNKAIERLDTLDDTQPFFLYIGVVGPHDGYIPPKRFIEMYNIDDIKLPRNFNDTMKNSPRLYKMMKDNFKSLSELEQRQALLHYYAFCTYEDYLFGLLMEKLKSKSFYKKTVVMYTSDHGDYAGAHGLWAKGLACYKEAYHIPLIIFGPDKLTPSKQTTNTLCSIVDLGPTILDIANIDKSKLSGHSLFENIKDPKNAYQQEFLYTQSNGNELYGIQRSVFSQNFKYVHNTFDMDEFYDYQNDKEENFNLINDSRYQDKIVEYTKLMWKFAFENDDSFNNPYILVGLNDIGPGIVFE